MKIVDYVNKNNIEEKITEFCKDSNVFTLTVISWEDGDGFIDLTEEDGGMNSLEKVYFKLKDKCFKIKDRQKLFKALRKYIKIKCFSSKNGIYRLGFDIIITFSKYRIVYCPEVDEGYVAKLNVIERRFIMLSLSEPWDYKKFGYWIKQFNN